MTLNTRSATRTYVPIEIIKRRRKKYATARFICVFTLLFMCAFLKSDKKSHEYILAAANEKNKMKW